MPTLTIASYALAAAGCLVLACLLATRWRDRLRGTLLLATVLVTAGWAAHAAVQPAPPLGFGHLVAELAKQLVWLFFLTRVLGAARQHRLTPLLRFGPLAVAGIALACGALADGAAEPVLGVISLERATFVACLALSITGFVLVEQTIRNTREGEIWAAKFVWLAVGALFAYDVALFSVCYVLGAVEANLWGARGLATACVIPLLAIGLERVRNSSRRR